MSRRNPRSPLLLLILPAHLAMLAGIVSLGLSYMLFGDWGTPPIWGMSLVFTLLTVWCLATWVLLSGSLFNLYGLFLIAALLFNGGQSWLQVVGLLPGPMLFGWFSPDVLLEAIYCVTLGIAATHGGAILRWTTAGRKRAAVRVLPPRDMRVVGWSLLAISGVPTLYILSRSLSVVLASGYMGLYQQRAATGFGAAPQILATFLVPSALFLLAGSKGRLLSIGISLLVVAAFVAIQFFLGSRSAAALPLIAYAWLWHRCIRPLPVLLVMAGGSVLLFVIFPLIQSIRGIAGAGRFALETVVASFFSIGNPVVAIVSEMGGSMLTVAYTLQLVPSIREFDWGAGYVYALTTVFPNLFWEVHPAIARGTASHWLVWTVDPSLASIGGGLGYSFIAEAYLNFGWFGAPLALLIIGYLIASLDVWVARSPQPARYAMVACFMAFFLMFARGELVSFVRPLLWYAVLPYLAVAAVGSLRTMRGTRASQQNVRQLQRQTSDA